MCCQRTKKARKEREKERRERESGEREDEGRKVFVESVKRKKRT